MFALACSCWIFGFGLADLLFERLCISTNRPISPEITIGITIARLMFSPKAHLANLHNLIVCLMCLTAMVQEQDRYYMLSVLLLSVGRIPNIIISLASLIPGVGIVATGATQAGVLGAFAVSFVVTNVAIPLGQLYVLGPSPSAASLWFVPLFIVNIFQCVEIAQTIRRFFK
jgi:hypothetical protein